jgi:hypothetical protein
VDVKVRRTRVMTGRRQRARMRGRHVCHRPPPPTPVARTHPCQLGRNARWRPPPPPQKGPNSPRAPPPPPPRRRPKTARS